jgi:hypothetical protein
MERKMRKGTIRRSVRSKAACSSRQAGVRKQGGGLSAAGAEYERSRDLPALIALWPWEIENLSLDGQQRLVARLRRALRLERQRAIQQHWTYDLARHARLLKAYRSELASLEAMLGSADRKHARGARLASLRSTQLGAG